MEKTLIGFQCDCFITLTGNVVVEDGYEFFAKRQLVTLFSAPNYCGEFDNAGGMMSVDETLMCSFQVTLILSVVVVGFMSAAVIIIVTPVGIVSNSS
uniref:Uncharacterized protein n=1 Tax=Parascaris equorum TaxID=6256 RepID=A0A914RMV1_PAREQ